MRPAPPLLLAALSVLIAVPALAQRGDRKGHDMKEVWHDMNVPPAPVRSPAEELATFKLAPGFHAELVAAEPMVETPVAMKFDERGRLWVVEMRGYMPNVDGTGEYESNLGRISVLEDTDGDGRMDKVTRFLEGLKLPRAIGLVKGGVLVAEPPTLWFCPDADGDLKADAKIKVADYGAIEPIETTENGLLQDIDNWIYSARSTQRFQWKDGKLIVDRTASRGQWGIAQDDYGRLYFNANEMPMMVDLFAAEYYRRNPTMTGVKALAFKAGNMEIFPIRPNPGVNRGYTDNFLRPDGSLRKFTAASSILIYRGDQFPADFRGNAIVPGPCGNIVKRFTIEPSGPELRPSNYYPSSELLASTDERFRPVSAYDAPDGCVYFADIYHGILQHKIYMTTFLRKQVIERGLDKPGQGLGRIWRIVSDAPGSKKPGPRPNLADASTAELVKTLNHPSGWWRDTAQRLILDRADTSAVDPLRSLVTSADAPVTRIHALWTLHGLGAIDKASVLAALSDSYPQVRAAALRTAEPLLKSADAPPVLAAILARSMREDQSTRIQLMLTIGDAADDPKVRAAMAAMLDQWGDDVHMRQAAVSGLAGRELAMLNELAANKAWADPKTGRPDVLADIASSAMRANSPSAIALLDLAAAQSGWKQLAILTGAYDATRKQKMLRLASKPAALDTLAKSKDKLVVKRITEINKGVTWPGDARQPAKKELTGAQKAQFEQGRLSYMMICMACHQIHGGGQAGLAPPLVDSPFAQGPPNRVIRIALHGIQGPVKVNDEEWNLVMPGLKDNPLLDDEKLAAVLTYVRNEWGNAAEPITKEQVTKVREATKDRVDPWQAKELMKIK